MKSSIIVATALAGSLMTSACTSTSWRMFASPVRPECGSQNYVIYYNYHEDDLRASSAPIIQRIAQQVGACQKAGGQLKSVTVVGFPNRRDNSVGGDDTAAARGQAVLDALAAAGVPAEKIKLANYRLEPDDLNQPMRRRAEITIEMK